MEKSTAFLTYKGSISEAIIEAQKQKKLFLVFISGEDDNSISLEHSTWLDDRVAAAVSRYCIFLHLIQGNVETSQFAAIYPQNSVPSISAVGYNGVMLWQHEGHINGKLFVENIEKAWATMHFQDTAAVLLSAALASKKPEPSNSSFTDVAPVEHGEASNLHDSSSLADNQDLNIQAEPSNHPVTLVEGKGDDISDISDPLKFARTPRTFSFNEEGDDISDISDPLKLDTAKTEDICAEDDDNKENETLEITPYVTQNAPNFQAVPREHQSNESHPKYSPEPVAAIHLSSSGSSQLNADDAHEGTRSVDDEIIDREGAMKSNTIHLSIRMPGGASLQEKFTATDNFRSVKNYVDDNYESNLGSYDLAIPYPRKVFGEEDMNKPLSELGFAGRQALIVIPNNEISRHQSRPLPSNNIQIAANQSASNDNSVGYFGYLKRALSYMNPFSYLGGGNGGSSSSQQTPNDDLWQYRPNPGLQNPSLRNPYSSAPQNPNGSRTSSSRATARPFGGNIHTLRHEEEDDLSSRDRNTFWNGNSTQYGGNDK